MQAFQRVEVSRSARAAPEKKLRVLQLQRATAVGVAMARLPCGWRDVATGLREMHPALCASLGVLEALFQCMPTDDERQLFESHLRFASCSSASKHALYPRFESFYMF